jgi:TRAP transporter TAXI family solute receptor
VEVPVELGSLAPPGPFALQGAAVLASLRRFFESPRALVLAAIGALVFAALSLYLSRREDRMAILLAAGDARGRRAEIAQALANEARSHGLDVTVVESEGSEDSREMVERREVDVALVQGGLDGNDDVREVAPLVLESLHLLVRGDSDVWTLEDLRGQRVMLAPPRSGTRSLSLSLTELAGLHPGHDYTEVPMTYAELDAASDAELPDAIFHISTLPSPNARRLLIGRGYRLVPLPFAQAMSLRDVAVSQGVIPAYAYDAAPATPREDVPTLATRMIAIASRHTRPEAVRRLLEALESERFLRHANLPRPDPGLFLQPEFPLHPGTVGWMHRDDPLFTSEDVQGIESLRSFIVSLIVALVLLYRWWRTRRLHGLDSYLADAARIDRDAMAVEDAATLDLPRMLALRGELGKVKTSALAAFARGEIHSEELLSSFLVHCADVRQHLDRMILSERERMQKVARGKGEAEADTMRALWAEALQEEHDDKQVVPPKPVAKAPAVLSGPAEPEPSDPTADDADER